MQGKVLGLMFFEPSTRTATSFLSAMQRLGGTVAHMRPSDSSQVKGESLEGMLLLTITKEIIANVFKAFSMSEYTL